MRGHKIGVVGSAPGGGAVLTFCRDGAFPVLTHLGPIARLPKLGHGGHMGDAAARAIEGHFEQLDVGERQSQQLFKPLPSTGKCRSQRRQDVFRLGMRKEIGRAHHENSLGTRRQKIQIDGRTVGRRGPECLAIIFDHERSLARIDGEVLLDEAVRHLQRLVRTLPQAVPKRERHEGARDQQHDREAGDHRGGQAGAQRPATRVPDDHGPARSRYPAPRTVWMNERSNRRSIFERR
mgnify:CR=1 FL=1